jgi:DNA-binding transcriptional regulator YiaG
MAKRTSAFVDELSRLAKKEVADVAAPILQGLRALRADLDSFERTIEGLGAASARRRAPRRGRPPASRTTAGGKRMTAAQIRALRKRLGLSQQKMAKLLSVSPAAVQTWEQNRSRPRGKSQAALAAAARMTKAEAEAAAASAKPARKRRSAKGRKRKTGGRKKKA